MKITRRELLATAALAATTTLGTAKSPPRTPKVSTPQDLAWTGPQMLDAFMKARSSLHDEFTVGWVDASTYAVIGGATLPLYRLLAATWQKHHRVSDTVFEGKSLEVAFYLDINSGERLEKLTMPRTGTVVTVPNYRAGPSANKQTVAESAGDEFNMGRETQGGNDFFSTGISEREQKLSQAQRDGADFLIRQTLGTRVVAKGSDKPVFYYHEWTVNRAAWRDIVDPTIASCAVEVQYASIAAFRPWMQMQTIDGHTIQHGRGAKVWRAEQLPPRLLALCRQYHPDLIADPSAAFASSKTS